jgi:hypothetical protein
VRDLKIVKGNDVLKSFSFSRVQSLDLSPKGFSLVIRRGLSLGGALFKPFFSLKKKTKKMDF